MTDVGASAKLDIGRVIQQLFAVLGRNFVTFAILAVLLSGLPTAIIYGLQGDMTTAGPNVAFGPRMYWGLIGALVGGTFTLILQGTIIYATAADLNDRKLSVAESLSAGLRVFLPILAIGLLATLAAMFGMILLIVPGVMIAIAWCVAVPSYVVERTTIMGSFGRSAELTRGNRWRIFGMFCLLLIAILIVEMLVVMLGGLTNFVTVGGFPLVTRIFVMPLVNVASALLGAVGAAVLYVELRRIKDGVGAESLAAIFD